jgi:hypothetical protein
LTAQRKVRIGCGSCLCCCSGAKPAWVWHVCMEEGIMRCLEAIDGIAHGEDR